jgi:hypothetical protein
MMLPDTLQCSILFHIVQFPHTIIMTTWSHHHPHLSPPPQCILLDSLHAAEHTSTTSTTPSLRLPLHLLANLDIHLEELGYAAV